MDFCRCEKARDRRDLIVALFAAVLALDPFKWTNNASPIRSVDTIDAMVRSVQWNRVGIYLVSIENGPSVSHQGRAPASDRRACNHRARHARQWFDLLPVSRMSGGRRLFPRPVSGRGWSRSAPGEGGSGGCKRMPCPSSPCRDHLPVIGVEGSFHSRPSRSSSSAKNASWSMSRITMAFFGRLVTPHQSITVMPMVSSEAVSTVTLQLRPLNSSGFSR